MSSAFSSGAAGAAAGADAIGAAGAGVAGAAAGVSATGAGAGTATGAGGGAAWGAGSLTGGAPTEVSPVNGFLYSLFVVMTSRALGLYPAGAAGALAAAGAAGRLPRARPEPRVAPNDPKAGAGLLTGAAGLEGAAIDSAGAGAGADKSAEAGAGAPDFSVSDMCVWFF